MNVRVVAGLMVIVGLLGYASRTKDITLIDPLLEGVGMKATRNMRNRNPGNMRHGPKWLGLAADQSDSEFSTFVDFVHGYRGLVINLRNQFRLYGLMTVRGIISKFAPSNENDTESYVDKVSKAMRVSPDAPLDMESRYVLESMAKAITRHEGSILLSGDSWANHERYLAQGLTMAGALS